MTERLPDDVSRRTVLRATGIAAAGSAGLAGVASAGSSSTQTDDFTLKGETSRGKKAQRTSGDIDIRGDHSDATVDITKILIHSVDGNSAIVSASGKVTPEGGTPQRFDVSEQTVGISAERRSAMLLSQNQCPGESQQELITLTLNELNLNVLGLVVFIDNIDLAICCEPGLLLGELLCGLLVTE